MFGLLKKIFKKDAVESVPTPPPIPGPAYARTAVPGTGTRPSSNPFSHGGSGAPFVVPAMSPAAAVKSPASSPAGDLPDAVALPLGTVLAGLPPEFQNLFLQNASPNAEVNFSLQAILPQLSSGRVRVAFGELRRGCPNGACKGGAELDSKLIDLPLANILARINPALLPRKTQRQLMDVPKDVTGLFGTLGEPLTMTASATHRSAPVANDEPAPVVRPRPSVSHPMPAAAAPAISVPRKQAVPADIESIPSPFSRFTPIAAPAAAATEPAVVEATEPVEMPRIKFDPGLAMGKSPSKPAVATTPVAPPAAVPRPSVPKPSPAKLQEVKDDNYLKVALAEVTDGWPDAVLEEIQQLDLSGAQFALPAGEIDLAMRKGRIVFKWQTLLSWIEAGGQAAAGTANGDQDLTLPLKVVAPKFLALRQPKGRQKKAHVEESIPDLFMGGPAPGPIAVPASVSTPAPAPMVTSRVEPATEVEDVPVPAVKAPAPAKAGPRISAANPNDLVAKTAQLTGVTGSLLAMNDGLVVASQLPKPLQGETVAAFLPQNLRSGMVTPSVKVT